jgi:hypothetical protein
MKKYKKTEDEKRMEMLEEFANDHALAKDIEVIITSNSKSFTPRYPESYAKYEEANLLASLITGAESFLYWMSRKGYEVKRVKRS